VRDEGYQIEKYCHPMNETEIGSSDSGLNEITTVLCLEPLTASRDIASNSIPDLHGGDVRDLVDHFLIVLKIGGEPIWELPHQIFRDSLNVCWPDLSQRITVSVSNIQAVFMCFR